MNQYDDIGGNIRNFLELWQKQFAELSRDPQVTQSTLQLFQQMHENYMKAMDMMAKGKAFYESKPNASSRFFRAADDEFVRLHDRIAGLEERIRKLESAPKGTRGKATKTD